ncbi:hypothetical protein GMLC_12050 [Geomonas limicola]|uniref:Lipoprotein n=1 Tax=Geomonas limicola TaxID=2740186 RepID=A0A6V8N524_9BACT|nr:hypothetical protein [Geomonas limicola]GFO67626.1 hypothetical protein GMLC_12050 [Geomonas limicola]
MKAISVVWKTFRGLSLLVVLAVVFAGAVAVSCLLRLVLGNGFADVAGKLHLGSNGWS